MPGVVDHSQDEDVVQPHDVEHSIREAPEVGPADLLVNDRESCGMGTDLQQGPIQVIPEGKIQARPLLGVPLLGSEEIPLCH